MMESLIESINIYNINENNIQEDKELCSICLDVLDKKNTESIYTLESCTHKYHSKCIIEMFINGNIDTCPLCRTIIKTKNGINTFNFEKFRINLIRKYSKKKQANILVKNLVNKYDTIEKDLKKVKRELNSLIRSKTKLNTYKDKLKYNSDLYRLKKIKRYVSVKYVKKSRGYFNYNFSVNRFKFIKNIIKKCNEDIKNFVEEQINETKENIKNIDLTELNNIDKEIKLLYTKQKRIRKKFEIIKENILNIPINPIRQ